MNKLISKTNIYHCKQCGNEIHRFPSEIRGKNVFCNRSCSAIFYNKNKIIVKECPGCHNLFHPVRGNKGIYCSSKISLHKRQSIRRIYQKESSQKEPLPPQSH